MTVVRDVKHPQKDLRLRIIRAKST